jgi:hypothetical protein
MVAPGQPWLDGYVVADGTIRQFVAAPLGLGVTAEGQITGKEEFGGLQLEVLPMLLERFEKKFPKVPQVPQSQRLMRGIRPMSAGFSPPGTYYNNSKGMMPMATASAVTKSSSKVSLSDSSFYSPQLSVDSLSFNCDLERATMDCMEGGEIGAQLDMGLAAGGRMRQQVFKDPHGIECWDTKNKTRVYIHMANSIGWQHVTGTLPPHPPMSASDYTSHGYPWFDYYSEGAKSHVGTDKLKGLKSLAELQKEKKLPLLPENKSAQVTNQQTVKLKTHKNEVRDGSWK